MLYFTFFIISFPYFYFSCCLALLEHARAIVCVTHCVRNSRNVSAKSIGVFLFKRPSGAQCDVNALRNLLRKKERKTKKKKHFSFINSASQRQVVMIQNSLGILILRLVHIKNKEIRPQNGRHVRIERRYISCILRHLTE